MQQGAEKNEEEDVERHGTPEGEGGGSAPPLWQGRGGTASTARCQHDSFMTEMPF